MNLDENIVTFVVVVASVAVVVVAAAVVDCQEHGLHAAAFSVSIESLL